VLTHITMQLVYCKYCNSSDIVLCNYEYTCRQCGSVLQEDYIQDKFEYNFSSSFSHESSTGTQNFKDLVKFKRLQDSCLNPLERYISDVNFILSKLSIDNIIKTFVIDIYKILEDNCFFFKGLKKKALTCVLIYYSSIHFNRGLGLNTIASWINIDVSVCRNIIPTLQVLLKNEKWFSDILQKQSGTKINNQHSTNSTLARMVYELDIFPTDIIPKIIKHGSNIYNKISINSDISTMKTKSLLSCCIYISCKIIKYKIKKTLFCKSINISLPTLQKTESYIQQILKTI
jgi:transcription initiation factor TFIIIB Brf1 subunit/transcription initiation factor TFIIB